MISVVIAIAFVWTHINSEVLGGAVDASSGGENPGQVLQGDLSDLDRVRQSDDQKAFGTTERPALTGVELGLSSYTHMENMIYSSVVFSGVYFMKTCLYFI